MKTSGKRTSVHTEEKSTFSPADSPASHTVSPEKGWERMIHATCGRQCLEQFSKSDRIGSWAKMFSELLVGMRAWYSRRCTLTWKMKVTKFNRMYFRLLPSVRPTAGTGYGLLPTVLASEGMGRGETVTSRTKTRSSGKSYRARLSDLAISGLLPTPTAISDSKGGCTRLDPKRQRGTLAGAIHGIIGIPGKTSHLNPRFVLEMMGFPPSWTQLPFQGGGERA